MEEWKQRLKSARLAKGLNKTKFAKAVGVSNPTVTDWEKSAGDGGIKELSGLNLTKVCQVLDVTPGWLLHGEEAPPPRAADPGPDGNFGLPPGTFRKVQVVDDDDPSLVRIPKVRFRLSAGISGFEVEPERYDGSTTTVPADWMMRNGYYKDNLVSIVVKGESMEPTLYEGDLVVINTADKKMVDGVVYAFNYEGEAVVKRLERDGGQWYLKSDNHDQRKFGRKTCRGDACIIIGRVVRKESERL